MLLAKRQVSVLRVRETPCALPLPRNCTISYGWSVSGSAVLPCGSLLPRIPGLCPSPSQSRPLLQVQAQASQAVVGETKVKPVVKFAIPYKTNFGEIVKIVGNHPLIGAWNLAQAPKLTWSEGDVWVGDITLDEPANLEFKFVVCAEGNSTYQKWEGGDNRLVEITSNAREVDVQGVWDSTKTTAVAVTAAPPPPVKKSSSPATSAPPSEHGKTPASNGKVPVAAVKTETKTATESTRAPVKAPVADGTSNKAGSNGVVSNGAAKPTQDIKAAAAKLNGTSTTAPAASKPPPPPAVSASRPASPPAVPPRSYKPAESEPPAVEPRRDYVGTIKLSSNSKASAAEEEDLSPPSSSTTVVVKRGFPSMRQMLSGQMEAQYEADSTLTTTAVAAFALLILAVTEVVRRLFVLPDGCMLVPNSSVNVSATDMLTGLEGLSWFIVACLSGLALQARARSAGAQPTQVSMSALEATCFLATALGLGLLIIRVQDGSPIPADIINASCAPLGALLPSILSLGS